MKLTTNILLLVIASTNAFSTHTNKHIRNTQEETRATTYLKAVAIDTAQEGAWKAYLDDEKTGLVFYYNQQTGESMWEPPSKSFPKVQLADWMDERMLNVRNAYAETLKKDRWSPFPTHGNLFIKKEDAVVVVDKMDTTSSSSIVERGIKKDRWSPFAGHGDMFIKKEDAVVVVDKMDTTSSSSIVERGIKKDIWSAFPGHGDMFTKKKDIVVADKMDTTSSSIVKSGSKKDIWSAFPGHGNVFTKKEDVVVIDKMDTSSSSIVKSGIQKNTSSNPSDKNINPIMDNMMNALSSFSVFQNDIVNKMTSALSENNALASQNEVSVTEIRNQASTSKAKREEDETVTSTSNKLSSPKREDKFDFAQRIESTKAGLTGLIAGASALVPFNALHSIVSESSIDKSGQFQFDTALGGVESALFGIVYRYCVVREEDNDQLGNGVAGAFAVTRALSVMGGKGFDSWDLEMVQLAAWSGLESLVMFGVVKTAIDFMMEKGIVKRME